VSPLIDFLINQCHGGRTCSPLLGSIIYPEAF